MKNALLGVKKYLVSLDLRSFPKTRVTLDAVAQEIKAFYLGNKVPIRMYEYFVILQRNFPKIPHIILCVNSLYNMSRCCM